MPSDYERRWEKARATERRARLFAQYELTKRGYRRVFLLSKKGHESTGIVDLVAIKKTGEKRDSTEIVLIQVKGGRQRVKESEKERLKAATRKVVVRCGIIEYLEGHMPKLEFLGP